ncbi:MAG: hypothetical protein M1818_001603 [Claussenomyces sp. TS43310]|nr:MAG: hypothetical protein M1818_001603 [Claussenomyces sp. TS43310]
MSLTVKHLNADASFLLTFEPLSSFPPSPGPSLDAFTIVLDPWLQGSSKIWHPKFSVSTHREPACVSSLAELQPDLVIISQDKDDHCHAPTLKTLPGSGGKTTVLAQPAAAKTIRSWKHFDAEKIVILRKWDESKAKTVHRIVLPALHSKGSSGEITVAFLSQKHDITGLHGAIGITYRPPTASLEPNVSHPLTPPASPSLNSSRWHASPNTLSVIFSPHGIPYSCIAPYASSHLVRTAALPLTALLHCFDRVTNPWYLGGNICAGFPGGLDIAQSLLAGTWISAHDGIKETKGFASTRIMTRRFDRQEVENMVSPQSPESPRGRGTEVVVLGVGQDIRLGQSMVSSDQKGRVK